MTRCSIRTMIVAAGLLAALAGLEQQWSQAADSPPQAGDTQPKQGEPRTISVQVVVQPYESVRIYPRAAGQVEKVMVDIGSKVRKGEVLAAIYAPEVIEDWETKKAQIELREAQIDQAVSAREIAEAEVKITAAKLNEAKAMLGHFEASVKRWEIQVHRLKREVDNKVVDAQVLQETERELESKIAEREAAKATILKADGELFARKAGVMKAAADVKAARARLKMAQAEVHRQSWIVDQLRLVAPFDGVVSQRRCNVGDLVQPTDRSSKLAPLFIIQRTDVFRVVAAVPERDVAFIHVGDKAVVELAALPTVKISASVTRLSPVIDRKTGTMTVEMDVANPDGQIYAGMSGTARIVSAGRR